MRQLLIMLLAFLIFSSLFCTKVVEANGVDRAGNFTIAIDPGHQLHGNSELEPIGPGATQKKAKVAPGTRGVATKVPEYQLTLDVSLKLRDELIARGYRVFMTREINEVNISNRERAAMATEAGADIFIRVHADGSENRNAAGILTICPTSNNPYIPHLYPRSRALSDAILSSMVAATGAHKRGVREVDNMSGMNWSTMPVTILEMGFMTNPAEDRLMQTKEYQQKLVMGIADGVDLFFDHFPFTRHMEAIADLGIAHAIQRRHSARAGACRLNALPLSV